MVKRDEAPSFIPCITSPPLSPTRPAQRSGHSARHVDGAGYRALTFPLWVYGAVKIGIPPQVFVLSTLICRRSAARGRELVGARRSP
ncbi:hypothetical protein THICB3290053 [Thiomonas sp. CB3]|nr:hypothetical protein THICB3290053 [Thiomonas sp. CB3]